VYFICCLGCEGDGEYLLRGYDFGVDVVGDVVCG